VTREVSGPTSGTFEVAAPGHRSSGLHSRREQRSSPQSGTPIRVTAVVENFEQTETL
jgi:hypothetical protein